MKPDKRMARSLANEVFSKLAFDIELLDVRKKCEYTNYFLVVSGKNRTHLNALADTVSEFALKHDVASYGRDGVPDSGWMIFDFGDIIVHAFLPETRRYYDLMSIWGDAKPVELELTEVSAKEQAEKKTPNPKPKAKTDAKPRTKKKVKDD